MIGTGSGLTSRKRFLGALTGGGDYTAALAAVGLYPDNPDQMFAWLMTFLSSPKPYKQADKCWPGPQDEYSWYESPTGVAQLIWPFDGGKWHDSAPQTEAQIRAVFKIPAGVGTKQGLAQLYGFPYVSSLRYAINVHGKGSQCDSGFDLFKSISQGIQGFVDLANLLHIPLVNVTAALFTGKDPIAAIKADVNSFMQAGAIAKGVVSGDLKPLGAQAAAAAGHFGIQLSAQDMANIAQAAETGDPSAVAAAAIGPSYRVAWQMATNYGTSYDAQLAPPPGQSYAPSAIPPATPAEALSVALSPPVNPAPEPPDPAVVDMLARALEAKAAKATQPAGASTGTKVAVAGGVLAAATAAGVYVYRARRRRR